MADNFISLFKQLVVVVLFALPMSTAIDNNDFYIIDDGNFDDWKTMIDEFGRTVQWHYTYEEYDLYHRAFGSDKFKFLTAKLKCKYQYFIYLFIFIKYKYIILANNELIGSIYLVKYDDDSAFVGAYYIFPKYRGAGIGCRLFDELIKQTNGENMNVALFACLY